jgi:hypothetical protein
MLSDAEADCVSIGLAVCLNETERIAPESTSGTNEDHNTHMKTS